MEPRGRCRETHIRQMTDIELTLSISGINEVAAKAIEADAGTILDAFKRRLGTNGYRDLRRAHRGSFHWAAAPALCPS